MKDNSEYDLHLDRFEKTLVCIYDKDRDVIIYWEPILFLFLYGLYEVDKKIV
jgi:hypothetical protein